MMNIKIKQFLLLSISLSLNQINTKNKMLILNKTLILNKMLTLTKMFLPVISLPVVFGLPVIFEKISNKISNHLTWTKEEEEELKAKEELKEKKEFFQNLTRTQEKELRPNLTWAKKYKEELEKYKEELEEYEKEFKELKTKKELLPNLTWTQKYEEEFEALQAKEAYEFEKLRPKEEYHFEELKPKEQYALLNDEEFEVLKAKERSAKEAYDLFHNGNKKWKKTSKQTKEWLTWFTRINEDITNIKKSNKEDQIRWKKIMLKLYQQEDIFTINNLTWTEEEEEELKRYQQEGNKKFQKEFEELKAKELKAKGLEEQELHALHALHELQHEKGLEGQELYNFVDENTKWVEMLQKIHEFSTRINEELAKCKEEDEITCKILKEWHELILNINKKYFSNGLSIDPINNLT